MTAIKKHKVVWSQNSKNDLKNIYHFIKNKSQKGAKNVISDIRKATTSITYSKQVQVEPYYPECRRIVVRNYKVLYQFDEAENILYVIRIFDTRRNPERMNTGDF